MKKILTKEKIKLKHRLKDALSKTDYKDCVLFWRRVVCQAIIDALSKNMSEKKKAVIWILKDEKDFNSVCDWAQIAPHKLRQIIFNKLIEQDPNIIEKLLCKKPEKLSARKICLTYKSVRKAKITTQINFVYNSQEIRAYTEDDELLFDLTHLNGVLKFADHRVIRLVDLDTYVDAINLRKTRAKTDIIYANIKGISQLAVSFKNENLRLFSDWIEKGMYKYNLLKGINFFYLKFQDVDVLTWLHQKRLFLHLPDFEDCFPLSSKETKKKAQQKDKHFYVYLNSTKRQFMVRSDLLIQIIATKNVIKKEHKEMRPQLIQWIKEQQNIFEGGDE